MSRLQCTFNWINFSFITQSLKTKHIRMTRQALPPDTEQEPNYFNIILNYSISPRLADDHDTVWEHRSKRSSVKSSHSRVLCRPWVRDKQVFSFSLFSLKPQTGRAAGKTEPQVLSAVSWPTSASQGGVNFHNSLSEKQMTDTLFELCNQEQVGVTDCSVHWTSF